MSEDRSHALTIIVFLGYVFSPFYARARKKGRLVDPLDHPAMNVALYGPKGHMGWALTERDSTSVHLEPGSISIGPNRIWWEDDVLNVRFDETASFLGGRIKGEVRLFPEQRFSEPLSLDDANRHHWCAVAPMAKCEVEVERPGLRFSGSGYHDTNWGHEPIEDGFHYWNWSRADLQEGTTVLYDVIRRGGRKRRFGLLFRKSGSVEPIDPPVEVALKNTAWKIPRATRVDLEGFGRVIRTLEDTPFYARSVLETRLLGQSVAAMHETLDLDRFRSPLVQWMLTYRMKQKRTR